MNDNGNKLFLPRHPWRGLQKYDALREAGTTAVRSTRRELFNMHIIATSKGGELMDNEQNFLIDLVFKPNENAFKLRPQETQLLLAYMSEILKEIEAEEILIIEEHSAAQNNEVSSCK
jgi:hypothetical protein